MPYYTRTRVVFQSRTRFWKADKISTNWAPPDPRLNELWSMADEVNTPRGILLGGAQAGVAASASLPAFQELYPGKSADIERVIVHDWSKDPWAGMCERISYRPGELARFWPEVARPCGRIHFAGAYAAQMSWGQEAALESAEPQWPPRSTGHEHPAYLDASSRRELSSEIAFATAALNPASRTFSSAD
jgi:monoamine oxidase